jgi:hemolysin III
VEPFTQSAEQARATATRRPLLRGVLDGVVAVGAVPAIVLLVLAVPDGLATAAVAVYGVGLVGLFGVSAVYHTPTWSPRVRARLRRLDHAAIFLFIAASYTPFCLCTDLPHGPLMLGIVWAGAAAGIAKCLLWTRSPRAVTAALYVVLGLTVLPFVSSLWETYGGVTFTLCAVGGALYITGALVYVKRWPDPAPRVFGYHEVFHLFVFGGAACHYAALWRVVT